MDEDSSVLDYVACVLLIGAVIVGVLVGRISGNPEAGMLAAGGIVALMVVLVILLPR